MDRYLFSLKGCTLRNAGAVHAALNKQFPGPIHRSVRGGYLFGVQATSSPLSQLVAALASLGVEPIQLEQVAPIVVGMRKNFIDKK